MILTENEQRELLNVAHLSVGDLPKTYREQHKQIWDAFEAGRNYENAILKRNQVEAQVKPANGENKFQKFYLGEKVLLTIPMEAALKDVDKKRLSSKGIIKMIWLKLGKTAIYEVSLEREVLGERKMQTDGRILSRLSV